MMELIMELSRPQIVSSWVLQIVVALVLFQTLFFKFAGAEESVYIFSTLGMEPWGRIGSGIAELIACALLLHPRTAALGAAISAAIVSGAVVAHLTRLGIVVKNDGGLLFGLALVVLTGSIVIVLIRRTQLPIIGARLAQLN
jgi:uncharacterized membrane protein YphA (DoxX/SURF4 family)